MIHAQINQTRLRGGQHYPIKQLIRVLQVVEQVIGKKMYDVSVAFVSPKEMRQANHRYRGKDRLTDVLSFELTPESGEILISYEQAKKQAEEMQHSTRDEITFLIVHGLLHLFGHDHEYPLGAKKMFRLQEMILTKLGVDARLSL